MNCAIYLFGVEADNPQCYYSQYPNDYAEEIFRRFDVYLKEDSLLVLHRTQTLAYHIYMRKTTNGYIGMCLLLNSVWLNDKDILLKTFQDAFAEIVMSDIFAKVNDNGKVVSHASKIGFQYQDAALFVEQLQNRFERMDKYTDYLPAIDPSVSPNAVFILPNNASDVEWSQGLKKYRSLVSAYGQNKMGKLNSLLQKIENIDKERENLQQQNLSLQADLQKLSQQKKQTKKVLLLFYIIIIGVIVAWFVIKDKNFDINSKNEVIEKLQTIAKKQKQEKILLLEQNNKLEQEIQEKNNTITTKNNQIAELQNMVSSMKDMLPIIIKKIEIANVYYGGDFETYYGRTIYARNAMYLKPKITYKSNISGMKTLKIKWFDTNGNLRRGNTSPKGFSTTDNCYIYTGENTLALSGWGNSSKGHWSAGTYRIEIWMEDICLKSQTFRIY